jgi:hypothetical protein
MSEQPALRRSSRSERRLPSQRRAVVAAFETKKIEKTLFLHWQSAPSSPAGESFGHQVVRLRCNSLHVLLALRNRTASVFKSLHPAMHGAAGHYLQQTTQKRMRTRQKTDARRMRRRMGGSGRVGTCLITEFTCCSVQPLRCAISFLASAPKFAGSAR